MSGLRRTAGLAVVLMIMLVGLLPATARAASPTAAAGVGVSIGEIDLQGPSIESVVVTVRNDTTTPMRDVRVALTGPKGWNLAPSSVTLKGRIAAGASGTASFTVLVPEPQDEFVIRSFSAAVTYTGADGAGRASATISQTLGQVADDLSSLYDVVGSTTLETRASGDLDGDGNSLSREQLAEAGLTPGAAFTALGADLVWPDVAAGEPDLVSASGQAIRLSGQGERLVVVGTGIGFGATGTATVFYTDGTSTSSTVGFPNWCCQATDAHGATLVAALAGRNTPAGYANAEYDYSVFAHAVTLDPTKEVELVVLPDNGGVHLAALGLAS